jgi:4-diphosphocytidyl-2-C-methyl-D-erythritol kinase
MFGRRLSDTSLIIGAPAKVNLFLQVLARRPDGYHDINSLMIAVSLFDRLTVTRTPTPGVTLEVSANSRVTEPIPLDEHNLIAKAYRALTRHRALDGGIHVTIDKQIPVAAGLAGGSSDAAATLTALNVLWGLNLSAKELAEIGLEVGSDIPFFFSGGAAMVSGRGEQIVSVEIPDDFWLVLVTPRLSISTAASYAELRMTLTNSKQVFTLPRCPAVENLFEALLLSGNDFEEIHLKSFPELGRIKDGLLQNGARVARLSGSGPTVFGLYSALSTTEESGSWNRGDWHVSTVRPVALPIADFL